MPTRSGWAAWWRPSRHAFQLPLEEVQQGALEVRQQATRTILALGARLEPVQPGPAAQAATATRWNEGQAELALGILREYAQLLCEQRPSAGALMELILEGLYRGVGLDRVGFLLLDPQRRWLHPKRVLDVTGQRELPAFAATPGQASLMAFSLARDEAIWLGDPHGPSLPPDPELGRLCGGQCLIAPLAVAGKAIGCLYADRAASGRGLDAETFGRFRLFAHQARIGLSLIRPT
ncbi:MAG: hypothetical protein KatS3mg126_1271 [Lysobacteraceae bacterium]|nr:MAG: hypothetical protein KatS3mg126_1271 [Xanthomonadaceae bacterium]